MRCNVIQRTWWKCRTLMMLVNQVEYWAMVAVSICDNNKVFILDFLYRLSLYLRVFFLLVIVFLRIVSWRYLYDSIDYHVEVWLLFSGLLHQQLVHAVESFRIDSLGEIGVLLRPVLENGFKVRTDLVGLLQYFLRLLIKIKLNTVAHYHQV